MCDNTAALRKQLLGEVYAGALSGLGAMILDADDIQNADAEELEEIAWQYSRK